MSQEGLHLSATAKVKLTKLNENGELIGIEEHEVKLTEEEARNIWLSQQQE